MGLLERWGLVAAKFDGGKTGRGPSGSIAAPYFGQAGQASGANTKDKPMSGSLTIAVIALALMICASASARGSEAVSCTVIVDARSGDVLARDGQCDQRFPPFSSFKVPLAAMGYDAGILSDAGTPRWAWHIGLTAPERDRKPVDPTIWQKDSVLWYSREITRLLGAEAFGRYVAQLNYGNADVSGVPGQDDGMTHAWLGG